MMIRLLPLAFLATMGCIPENADITAGSFRAFISESTSFTLVKESITLDIEDELGVWDDNYSVNLPTCQHRPYLPTVRAYVALYVLEGSVFTLHLPVLTTSYPCGMQKSASGLVRCELFVHK